MHSRCCSWCRQIKGLKRMHSKSDDLTGATVLVTGVGGFLGGHIAKQLLARGYRVRGSVRRIDACDRIRSQLCTDAPARAGEISFVEADLCSDAGWDAALDGCRYVIHAASPFPVGLPKDADELVRTARDGALRVLRAAHEAGVARAVLTSSITAAGRLPIPRTTGPIRQVSGRHPTTGRKHWPSRPRGPLQRNRDSIWPSSIPP